MSPSHTSFTLRSLTTGGARQKVSNYFLLSSPILDLEPVGLQGQEPPGYPGIGVLHTAEPLKRSVVSFQLKVSAEQIVLKSVQRPLNG